MGKIRNLLWLPAGSIVFRHPAACLVIPGIADLTVMNQKYAPRRPYCRRRVSTCPAACSLIALTMIIGADIKKIVILPVIPPDHLFFAFEVAPLTTVHFFCLFLTLKHGDKPAS